MRRGHLQRHQSSAHLKERPFICSQADCAAAFALKHHLTRHEKLHEKTKPYECAWPDCRSAFPKHEQLRLHVCEAHTGESLFKCERCSMEFKSKTEFRRHERSVAHGSREYVCGVDGCGMTFPKWSQVVQHRKCEHKKKLDGGECESSMFCEECGRGPFKSDSSYRQHCRTHCEPTAPNPIKHACPQCAKEFSSRSSLKAHSQAVHSTELPFACAECGKAYGYRKLLKRHCERNHEDEVQRVVTTATTATAATSATAATAFFKERSLMCPIGACQRRFFRQYDLDRHLQSMHHDMNKNTLEPV